MKRQFLFIVLACPGVWCGGATPACGEESAGNVFLEEVRAEWEQRQERFRSFVAEWDEQRTTPKGMGGLGRNGRLPVEDVTHVISYRVACDGNRIRLGRSGVDYDADTLDFTEKHFIRVFDGSERRELFNSNKYGAHPAGFLNEAGFFDDGTYYQIQPVILTFRPLAKELGGIKLEEWGLSRRIGTVDSVSSRILERPRGPSVERLWLADEPGHRVMRRQLVTSRGSVVEEVTLTYDLDPQWGSICTGWTHVMRGDAPPSVCQLNLVRNATVQINVPVGEQEFRYTYPSGTVVKYEGTTHRAIALEDGTLRPITPGEFSAGIPYETLMQTPPPPEASPGVRGAISPWGYIILLAATATLIAGWRWRNRERCA